MTTAARHALVDADEGPRETTLEGPRRAEAHDGPDGIHTAGTSSQISDGASAVLLTTAERAEQLGLRARARVVDACLAGSDPVLMLTGPIPATRTLLDRTGLTIDDIDVVEINEAFASVVLAWEKETGADMDTVNPNGGAIALGHPLGRDRHRPASPRPSTSCDRTGGATVRSSPCAAAAAWAPAPSSSASGRGEGGGPLVDRRRAELSELSDCG